MATKKGTNKSETLKGTNGDDILLGRGSDDTLIGGNGNDRLDGGDGADELMGGDGNDVILPGKGDADAIDGGKGIDTVSYANFVPTGAIGITLQLHDSWELNYEDAAGDSFVNVERFVGTSARDYFYMFRHDTAYVVFGGDGDDVISTEGATMRGGEGADSLTGDADYVDTFVLELGKGADAISGFTDFQDMLQISHKEFDIGRMLNSDEIVNRMSDTNAIGTKAQFIYRQDNDQLFYDADGTGSEAAVLIADFDTGAPSGLDVHDFEIM